MSNEGWRGVARWVPRCSVWRTPFSGFVTPSRPRHRITRLCWFVQIQIHNRAGMGQGQGATAQRKGAKKQRRKEGNHAGGCPLGTGASHPARGGDAEAGRGRKGQGADFAVVGGLDDQSAVFCLPSMGSLLTLKGWGWARPHERAGPGSRSLLPEQRKKATPRR